MAKKKNNETPKITPLTSKTALLTLDEVGSITTAPSVYASDVDPVWTIEKEYDAIGTADVDQGDILTFNIPDYGYDKYIMDIANWQRQRISFGAEPGYYYFKIFFNFNTNYGLLGGLMSTIQDSQSEAQLLRSSNTAYGYLNTISKYHEYDNVNQRILALAKFTATLKDISLRTPWIFKTLSGLNTINSTYVSNFDKEKVLAIGLNQETVDNRIGTMIDLYKYACFDQMNCKEIVPANLRKFEMSIMVYHIPLNNYHNRAMTDEDNAQNVSIGAQIWRSLNGQKIHDMTNLKFDGEVPAKTTNDTENFSNMMSFKLFTFLNCEIDCENSNEYYIDGMSNESPFQLGNNQLKIKYDRVYEHRMNEWAEMFFGSDGFHYNRNIPNVLEISNEPKDFLFGYDESKNDYHKQRINALSKKWIGNLSSGKISILDYQKLILAKYYAPISDDVETLNDASPMNNIKMEYKNWINNGLDSKKQFYNRMFRN